VRNPAPKDDAGIHVVGYITGPVGTSCWARSWKRLSKQNSRGRLTMF